MRNIKRKNRYRIKKRLHCFNGTVQPFLGHIAPYDGNVIFPSNAQKAAVTGEAR